MMVRTVCSVPLWKLRSEKLYSRSGWRRMEISVMALLMVNARLVQEPDSRVTKVDLLVLTRRRRRPVQLPFSTGTVSVNGRQT